MNSNFVTTSSCGRNIEICSIFGFFFIGIIIGWSLLDRLWLIGGITGAIWSANVVNGSSRNGILARRIGANIALFIRDLQE